MIFVEPIANLALGQCVFGLGIINRVELSILFINTIHYIKLGNDFFSRGPGEWVWSPSSERVSGGGFWEQKIGDFDQISKFNLIKVLIVEFNPV